ncbi:hypothetical protein AAIR98_000279 [Elusimicrobium simillimum]|uniref:hypothetical protein n=1 Tax=Elusimicrobium simillimum TaxID=3143438 RepID=UPI003C6FBA8C
MLKHSAKAQIGGISWTEDEREHYVPMKDKKVIAALAELEKEAEAKKVKEKPKPTK